MARLIPAGMSLWPEVGPEHPSSIVQRYAQGWCGAYKDPDAKERLRQHVRAQGYSVDFESVAHAYGYAESYADRLVVPFRLVEYVFPGCWPGAAQEVGDCVSHSTKNTALLTFACEIAFAKPDEVTGAVEIAPEIPAEGIKNGAFSSESVYWWRGYNGDGWSCDAGVQALLDHGILIRKKYDQLGVDLTQYSGSQAHLYGSRSPGANIDAEEKLHNFRTVAEASTFEAIRDALGQGYGVSSCGGEGYSSTRDANGVSHQSGRWSHAMAIIGVDDRPSIKKLYGEPLVLIINSWGLWNSGPRRIFGTQIDIPEGSFWTPWSNCRNRDYHVLSGAKGWVRDRLPPLHLGIAV